MRHRMRGRQFGLPSDQRRALLRGLVRSLMEHDKIKTTETRAKDVRPIVEKLITMAKRDDLAARRQVRRYLDPNVEEWYVTEKTVESKSSRKGPRRVGSKLVPNPNYLVPRLFSVVAPRYKDRMGGYTRITRLGARRGDGAPMVVLELLEGSDLTAVAPVGEAPKAVSRRGLFGKRK